jgi:hypothetical protein
MFLGDGASAEPVRPSPSIGISVGVATLGVLVFGIIPMPLISAARDAVVIFGQH